MIAESLNIFLQILNFNKHDKGVLFLTTSKSFYVCIIYTETGLEYKVSRFNVPPDITHAVRYLEKQSIGFSTKVSF